MRNFRVFRVSFPSSPARWEAPGGTTVKQRQQYLDEKQEMMNDLTNMKDARTQMSGSKYLQSVA